MGVLIAVALERSSRGRAICSSSDGECSADFCGIESWRRSLPATAVLALLALTGCSESAAVSAANAALAAQTAAPQSAAFDLGRDPPVAPAPTAVGRIRLEPAGQFRHGERRLTSAAEIAAYDRDSRRLFVANNEFNRIDILDASNADQLLPIGHCDVSEYGGPTSVAARNGLLAVSVAPDRKSDPGRVVLFDVNGVVHRVLTVGHNPDMLLFTPDGRSLLVANEGEPVSDYSIDPEGSVSLIDVSGDPAALTQEHVLTLDFRHFNDQRDALDPSIRIFGPGATVAQDLEPEYLAVSPDSRTAWVVCQENNCIGVIDLTIPKITRLVGLGFKDHSLPGQGLDASDKDGAVRIRPWPVFGMYLPDAIACAEIDGQLWLFTANEGDHRDYNGYSEFARVSDLQLDPASFPNAAQLQKKDQLGRLRVTTSLGDFNGDGRRQTLYSFGTRSFAVWTADVELVFDSGDEFERITAAAHPEFFNSDHESLAFDDRSDNKGPEPEGITIGRVDGRPYAFIALERMGDILVYDVSDPRRPVFETSINSRDFSGDPAASAAADVGPEGLRFIPAEDHPGGVPLLVACHEVSGTTRVYRVLSGGAAE